MRPRRGNRQDMQSKSVFFSKQQAQTVNFIFDRLVQIVKRRFGCELGYFELSETEPRHKIIFSLLSKNDHVKLDDHIFFPVRVNNRLVGAAQVNETEALLKPSEKNYLLKLIGLILESALLTKTGIDELDALEQRLGLLDEHDNVVVLNQYVKSKQGIKEEDITFRPQPRFTIPCLIECRSSYDLFRMASEIHYYSNRHAFINVHDLDSATFESIEEFKSIGPVSIFIPELSELPRRLQKLFMRYFESFRGKNDPQFIVGSGLSYSELLGSTLVENDLVQYLCVAYLKMTRPFEDYVNNGVIEFFYDSLVKGPSEPVVEL